MYLVLKNRRLPIHLVFLDCKEYINLTMELLIEYKRYSDHIPQT